MLAGLFASVGILAALRHRDATGEGQRVEVSLLSSLLAALVNQGAAYTAGGAVPERMGNQHPSIAPYELLRCADGDLVLAVGNDRQFAALCAELGARRSWRTTSASRRTRRAWSTAARCARRWRSASPPARPPSGPRR